ncbi:MAG: hypothetical protein AB8F78_19445 [Saprospiraceae bacterium]
MRLFSFWLRVSFLAVCLSFSSVLFSQVESSFLNDKIQSLDSIAALSTSNTHLLDSLVYSAYNGDGEYVWRVVIGSTKIDSSTTDSYRRIATYDLDGQDSTVSISRSLFFRNDSERFTRRFQLDSFGREFESSHNYFSQDSQSSSAYRSFYQFAENGDTTSIQLLRIDSLDAPNIPEADFKRVVYENVAGAWELSNETYSTFEHRAPRSRFRLDRNYDNQSQAWMPGTYSRERLTGDIATGNTVLFDTSGTGLFTVNPIQTRISQKTTRTGSISPVEQSVVIEYRGDRAGHLNASNINRTLLYDSQGLLLEDSGKRYAVDVVTGAVQNPFSEFYYDYSYLANTDLLHLHTSYDSTYLSGDIVRTTLQNYYSQVSSVEPLLTRAALASCFDRIYVNGGDLIALPSKALGYGEVSLFSVDGKQIAEYTFSSTQQLSMQRPQMSGPYILTFSGAKGVCSQQVFVP